jgi:hypothetical protein
MPCIATMLITLMNVISKLRERFIGEPLTLNIVLITKNIIFSSAYRDLREDAIIILLRNNFNLRLLCLPVASLEKRSYLQMSIVVKSFRQMLFYLIYR